jgi:uroporphyrinogen-III synthase
MQAKVIGILESRTGAHLAELIERRGGIPLLAPALEEVPDIDAEALKQLLLEWRSKPIDTVIFQTGVGTRALFDAVDRSQSTDELMRLLAGARIVVRGPKPTAELNARRVRIDIRAATPFTTDTVMAALADISLQGSKVLVQRYGAANPALSEQLKRRGAEVLEIATYRWALPSNIQPLIDLLGALKQRRVDALLFTSAVQIHHLHSIALQTGHASEFPRLLGGIVIGSIGPVCSGALLQYGVTPTFEASPPKLGPMMVALDAALGLGALPVSVPR